MTRLTVPIGVLAACGAAVAAIGAPGVGATAGDSVHGGGELPPTAQGCENHFAVNARSDADGTNPRGILHFTDANCGRFFDAEIVCVRVSGNRASVLAELRHNRGDPRFSGLLAFFEDNGTPKGGTPPDRQQNERLTPEAFAARVALGCPPPIQPRTQLVHGNLTITDN